jgi:hypothetical protein
MLSSIFDEAVYGVPRDVGASEEDRDLNDGAIDDDRELEWLCIVPGLLETRGGRSRSEGGDIDRLLMWWRKGDGNRLWLGAGSERELLLAR